MKHPFSFAWLALGALCGLSCAAPASPPGGNAPWGADPGIPHPTRPDLPPISASTDELGPGTNPVIPGPGVVAPSSLPQVPEGPPGVHAAHYDAPAPKSIPEALGGPESLFPLGFEGLSFDWSAADLVASRPWVVNEARLAPPLAYVYREAAYDAGTGRGDNPWLIDNTTFGVVEYHFQRDAKGLPVGPLHKVVFVFEVSLPKDAVAQLREAGEEKWGTLQTKQDAFQLSYDLWELPEAEVRFFYSPGGAVAESLEIVNRRVPATKR